MQFPRPCLQACGDLDRTCAFYAFMLAVLKIVAKPLKPAFGWKSLEPLPTVQFVNHLSAK